MGQIGSDAVDPETYSELNSEEVDLDVRDSRQVWILGRGNRPDTDQAAGVCGAGSGALAGGIAFPLLFPSPTTMPSLLPLPVDRRRLSLADLALPSDWLRPRPLAALGMIPPRLPAAVVGKVIVMVSSG